MTALTNDQVERLATAIRRIACGDLHGPTGLELLAIAIAGKGDGTLADAVSAGFSDIAAAVERAIERAGSEIAEALRDGSSREATKKEQSSVAETVPRGASYSASARTGHE